MWRCFSDLLCCHDVALLVRLAVLSACRRTCCTHEYAPWAADAPETDIFPATSQIKHYSLLHPGEEMGLGKTVEVAALVLSRPAPPLQSNQEMTADGQLISRYSFMI